MLIDNKADVYKKGPQNQTPVNIILKSKNESLIKLLLNKAEKYQYPILHEAFINGDYDSAEEILKQGLCDVKDISMIYKGEEKNDFSIINFVCSLRFVRVGLPSIKQEGKARERNIDKLRKQQLEIAKILIEKGANINISENEWTPIFNAYSVGNLYGFSPDFVEIMKLLISNGADYNVKKIEKDIVYTLNKGVENTKIPCKEERLEVKNFIIQDEPGKYIIHIQ